MEDKELLIHYGVKGMKWGKRLKRNIDSLKRESSWKKELSKDMSVAEMNKVASRIQLENDYKRLSRKKNVGTKADKDSYLDRAKMNDKDLTTTVGKLRAKDNLHRVATEATRSQTEAAKRYATALAPVALRFAITGTVSPAQVTRALTVARLGENAVNKAENQEKYIKGLINERNQKRGGR